MKIIHCNKKKMKKLVLGALFLMCTLNILAQQKEQKNTEMNIKHDIQNQVVALSPESLQ